MGTIRWRSVLEVMTNLAIVAFLSYYFCLMWNTHHARAAGPLAGNAEPTGNLSNTANLSHLGMQLRGNAEGRLLLVAMSPTCIYCREDLPVFKHLVEMSRRDGEFGVVFATPKEAPDAMELLSQNAVGPSLVHRVSFTQYGIHRVPLVAVVEPSGAISHVWTGLINGQKEQDIIRAVSTLR